MRTRAFSLALAGLICFLQGVGAQTKAFRPAEAGVGISFLVGDPTGEFSRFVDVGYGGEFFGRFPLEPQGLVSLRADLGFLIYGYESSRVCFDGIGCRVQGRLQTSNGIFFGGIGPELALPLDWMRPYVNVILGFGYFSTMSRFPESTVPPMTPRWISALPPTLTT